MTTKKINISTEYIKLDSFLKLSGAALSGGQAKEMIKSGGIKVNGETCLMRGKKLRAGNVVLIEAGQVQYEVGSEN